MKRLVFLVTLLTFVFGGMLMAQAELELHFNSTSIEDNGSGRAEQWSDMSGKLRHATQGTADNMPVIETVGGLDVLRFEGDQYLTTAPFSSLGQPTDVYIIWKTDLLGDASQHAIDGITTDNRNVIYQNQGAETISAFAGTTVNVPNNQISVPFDWVLTHARFSNSPSDFVRVYDGSGVLLGEVFGSAGAQSLTGLTIGDSHDRDETPRPLYGYISEIRVYTGTSAELEAEAVAVLVDLTGVVATLPVELSSFTAIVTADMTVQVQWTAETETNMLGYHVYRGESNSISEAVRISGSIIPAANTSTEQHYTYVDEEVIAGHEYYYWLQSNDLDLTYQFHGPITVLVNEDTDPGTIPGVDLVTTLKSAYPNPFNPGTNVSFSLAEAANVTVTIYNNKGQLVRTLIDGKYYAKGDNHVEYWDGRDARGTDVASGIYYTIMRTDDGFTMSRKMVLMK